MHLVFKTTTLPTAVEAASALIAVQTTGQAHSSSGTSAEDARAARRLRRFARRTRIINKDDNIPINDGEHKGKYMTGVKMVRSGSMGPKKYFESYGNLTEKDSFHEIPIDECALRFLFLD